MITSQTALDRFAQRTIEQGLPCFTHPTVNKNIPAQAAPTQRVLMNVRPEMDWMSIPTDLTAMAPDACDVERYGDGTVLVRVHSCDRSGRKLPDAVFTFRLGDPQYSYWASRAQPASRHAFVS